MTNAYLEKAVKIINDHALTDKSQDTKPEEEIIVSMSVVWQKQTFLVCPKKINRNTVIQITWFQWTWLYKTSIMTIKVSKKCLAIILGIENANANHIVDGEIWFFQQKNVHKIG